MYLETRFRARMRGNSGAPSDSLPKPTPANGIVLFTVYCSGSRVRTPSTTRLVGSPTHGGFSLPHSALVLRALSDILPSFAHLFPSRLTSLVETSDGRYSHHRVAVIQVHFPASALQRRSNEDVFCGSMAAVTLPESLRSSQTEPVPRFQSLKPSKPTGVCRVAQLTSSNRYSSRSGIGNAVILQSRMMR